MYGYFVRLTGRRLGGMLTAIWFAALVALILALSFEPPADFRYGRY